ncbi:MAG: M23 family metallopeptidase [Peptococcaceae bacterium]|nr:M23 family metallopeptidase [Peptococcaceae bacterium]MDH7525533.1 M23 family metallopeptidase [Peptococcaceae bacterium]
MGKLWEPGERPSVSRYYGNYGKKKPLHERSRERTAWKSILWQSGISLVLFFLIWAVFQVDTPALQPVQARIRAWFTEDCSITPVLKFFSEVGLWGDTFDRAAFEASSFSQNQVSLAVPVSGQVTGPFGGITGTGAAQRINDGIIIAAPEGTPVKAAFRGVVTRLANDEEIGRTIEITSEGGLVFTYGHCKEILVNLNDSILTGQVIAKVGKTGKAAGPQLYFRVLQQGEPLDPTKLFLPAADKT